MVFYYTVTKENVTLTAQHFSISRKTFHKWFNRFKGSKYNARSLADRSIAPHRKRRWQVTLIQEESPSSSESKEENNTTSEGRKVLFPLSA